MLSGDRPDHASIGTGQAARNAGKGADARRGPAAGRRGFFPARGIFPGAKVFSLSAGFFPTVRVFPSYAANQGLQGVDSWLTGDVP